MEIVITAHGRRVHTGKYTDEYVIYLYLKAFDPVADWYLIKLFEQHKHRQHQRPEKTM